MRQHFQTFLGSPISRTLSKKHLLHRERTLSTSNNTILTGHRLYIYIRLTCIGQFCHKRKDISYRCLCWKNRLHSRPFLDRKSTLKPLCTQQRHQEKRQE